jgi:excisionase family DNA binding protein
MTGVDVLKLLTVAETAERCRTSIRTVRRWIAVGRIPIHRLGRRILIAEADLAGFLASCRKTTMI